MLDAPGAKEPLARIDVRIHSVVHIHFAPRVIPRGAAVKLPRQYRHVTTISGSFRAAPLAIRPGRDGPSETGAGEGSTNLRSASI